MKVLPVLLVVFMLTGGMFTSCKHHDNPVTPCDTCGHDTTHHNCDTCNINQDSLQHVKDSLAHAFTWTQLSIPGEASLTGVWVFDSTNILIVGNNLWRYNGKQFLKISAFDMTHNVTLNGALNGYSVFAISSNDYWLVYASDALHTKGNDGTQFDDYRPGATNASWGPASNDIFIVGNGGKIHHYDGMKFSDMTSPTTENLQWIWGTSHSNIWASGYNESKGKSILIHFDGTTWSEDAFSASGQATTWGIGSVWPVDSTSSHTVTIIAGTTVFHRTDNGIWRCDSDQVDNKLPGGGYAGLGVLGNNANDLMAIGGWGFVAHWNGKTWKKYDELFDYSNPAYGPAGFNMNGNTACVVGTKSGNSWVAIGRRSH